jgi:hypothetical protein
MSNYRSALEPIRTLPVAQQKQEPSPSSSDHQMEIRTDCLVGRVMPKIRSQ